LMDYPLARNRGLNIDSRLRLLLMQLLKREREREREKRAESVLVSTVFDSNM